MLNQKGIAPIIIIVIVALIGGVSFFVIKTKLATKSPTIQEQFQESAFGKLLKKQKPEEAPEIVGSVKGKINGGYYSNVLSDVTIDLTSDSYNKSGKSGGDGTFLVSQLPIGNYALSFSHPEYSFSELKIDVREGENILEKDIHGSLKNPKPLSLSGQAFSDKNANGVKDGNDDPFDASLNLYIKSSGNWAIDKTLKADSLGNFSLQVSKMGSYKLEPVRRSEYNEPGSVEFVVDGYGGSKHYSFAYIPTVSQVGFKIYVFNDKNENSIQDSGEEYIHYQAAQITNTSTGKSRNVAVPPEGNQEPAVEYGNYTIKLVPESSSWEYYFKITKGEASITVSSTSGHQTVILGAHKLY